MNKKQEKEKEIKDELQRRMGEFVTWIDENYPEDYTTSFVEVTMTEVALIVLRILFSL